jgi:hypothetical protein
MERLAKWVEFASLIERAIERAPTPIIRFRIEAIRRDLSEHVASELNNCVLTDEMQNLISWKAEGYRGEND